MIDSNFGICMNQQYQAGPEIFGSVFPDSLQNNDMQYLWDLGIRNVRIPLKSYGSRQIDIDWQRTATRKTKEFGFNITVGSGQNNGGGGHKPRSWVDFHNFILNDEVPWLIAQGIFTENDVYFIGNESEAAAANDGLVSIARTSNVVTCVYAYKHMMASGDGIICQMDDLSITNNQFGSERIVTVIDDYTFTFAHTGSDVATINNPSSVTNFFRYSPKTVFRAFKRLATLVKATELPMKLEYSCYHGVTRDNGSIEAHRYYIDDLIDIGLGDFDYGSLNMYSYTGGTIDVSGWRFFRHEVLKGYNAFGADHFRVTEWNLWHNNDNIPSPASRSTNEIMRRLEFMQSLGIQHFFFNYREHNNLLVVTKPFNTTTGQTWRDWWWSMIGGKQRQGTREVVFGTATPIFSSRTSPLAVVDSNMGMNIGQYQQGGVAHSSVDLDYLWDLGIRKLRIASGDPSYAAGVTACRNLALAAKVKGFHVMFQNSLGGFTATDAGWDTTKTQTRTFCDWARDNGIDEVNIFNEIDYSQTVGGGLTNSVDKQIAFAEELIDEYPTLDFCVSIAQSSMDYLGAPDGWIEQAEAVNALGLKVCYSVYGDNGDFEQFKDRIDDLLAVYPDLRITEWNINANWSSFPVSVTQQNDRIQEKFDFLQLRELEHYFFTWSWEQASDQFALKKADGTIRPWKNVLFENPTPRPAAVGRPVATDRPTIAVT